MLEIDYSLIPLSAEDEAAVEHEVERRIAHDLLPPPNREVNGRLVLLNPDPVQTVHQIPDELRPRLRRIMMPAQEGSTHLSAKRLYEQIIDSDERLYLIVLELQSEFRSLPEFLEYLPRLRAQYPELGVFLSGTLTCLREKLAQILADERSTLVLEFAGGQRVVEFAEPEEFTRRVTSDHQVVTYGMPFFTDIRLILDRSGRPVPFNLLSLRKLQGVLGHGEAEEVEVGKGRRERMIVIDVPVPLIHDFRFRQDRGLEFLGVVIDGETIQSRHFGEEKLEFRWVPMQSIDKFLHRGAAGQQDAVDMSEVSVLRVNTLTGEVSFVMSGSEEVVALDQAHRIGIRRTPPPPKGNRGKPQEEPEPLWIEFDQYIEPSSHTAQQDPMQSAVRWHFYHKLIGEEVEHALKQERYARRLKVASVGPLAGQTVKLLRRFGLERLIDEDSFHYLCDTPEEVPHYRQTDERYESHFANLVEVIREVAVGQPSDAVRIDDIAYSMPISTEWVDTGLARLDKVTTQDLEAVYQEMRLLAGFIEHEFRRNFDIRSEDVSFFNKIQTCREAGLIAKWLAEYKRGAYGEPMPEDVRPDVLFLGTPEDKQDNDTRFYFPSLSCMELFSDSVSKGLFRQFDYDFSVFLEEQMALAVHQAREDGVMQPGHAEFDGYFQMRMAQATEELNELQAMHAAIDDESSPIYQQMLEQEERNYHERYEQFGRDRAQVEKNLEQVTARANKLVDALKERLDRGEASLEEFLRDTPDHPELLEQRILGAANRTRERLRGELQAAFTAMTDACDQWRALLEGSTAALRKYLHYHDRWQAALEVRQTAALRDEWQSRISGRMEQLRRMKALEREQHRRRVGTQLRNYRGELTQMNERLAHHVEQNTRAATDLQAYVESAGGRLGDLRAMEPGEDPERMISRALGLRKLLIGVSGNVHKLGERVRAAHDELDQMRVRKQRHAGHLYQLRVDDALARAVDEHEEPVLPPAHPPGGKVPTEEDLARAEQAWTSQIQQFSGLRGKLEQLGQATEQALKAVRGQAVQFHKLQRHFDDLAKLIARKARLRASAVGLAERQHLMDEELADLPQRVREQFMPARKLLLTEVFQPEVNQRSAQLNKARTFILEALGLKHEPLKQLYLDHAIHRRFYARQFMRGGFYSADLESPLHNPTRNVPAALRVLQRALVHNYKQHRIADAQHVELPQLSHQAPRQILDTIANLAKVSGRGQFDYLVLPPTLPLEEGLALLHRKDDLYDGVPRLVLVFVTKFDPNRLRREEKLRESYFSALKHNVIVNIDGHKVVDNPRSIGLRLLRETLGCAIDIPSVEDPPEGASAQ